MHRNLPSSDEVQQLAAALEPALLTSTEAATVLGVSRQRIYRLLSTGRFDTICIRGTPFVIRSCPRFQAFARRRQRAV